MVKPRENRVPIMMSDDELSAVDDWRFKNRIATRSEAIRRLVQTGLAFDAMSDPLETDAIDLVRVATELADYHVEWEGSAGNDDPKVTAEYSLKAERSVYELLEKVTSFSALMGVATEPTRQMRRHESFDEAMRNANEVLSMLKTLREAEK